MIADRVERVSISLDSMLFGEVKQSSFSLESHTFAKIDVDVDGEQSMFVLKPPDYLIFQINRARFANPTICVHTMF